MNDNRLGQVENNVQRVLKPVAAPSAFREHLRDGLMMAAHHQQAYESAGTIQLESNGVTWLWFFIAMVFGAALSIIVLKLRMR